MYDLKIYWLQTVSKAETPNLSSRVNKKTLAFQQFIIKVVQIYCSLIFTS